MFAAVLSAVMLCNALVNPAGVEDPAPRLSWQLDASPEHRGAAQTAYRVVVSSEPGGPADLWDSGRVTSDASIQVPYAGKPLASRQRAYWQVTWWDERGQVHTTDPGTYWEMGLLQRSDWSAKWIGAAWHGAKHTGAPAPYLRRAFDVPSAPVRARLYISALGLFEPYLNGTRIGEDVFTPGWTDYRTRVAYRVYDVTDRVVPGRNVVGAILGDGWYCGSVGDHGREVYGDRPKLLAQLELTYADGRRQTIASDSSWQVARGPILEDDLLMGETYDARQTLPHAFDASGAAAGWQNAEEFPDPAIALSASLDAPVRIWQTLKPVSVEPVKTEQGRDAWLCDFGQNLVGNVEITLTAPAGTSVRLRHGEMRDADGRLYVTNLRSARATDYFTCAGDPGGERWSPRFTYHGFRYVEVSGLPSGTKPEAVHVVARALGTDLAPAGSFTCSNPLVNQLQHNIEWSERGNYVEVPTDCPQRDERLGWTGDAQVFVRTGAWNYDVAAFFTKWSRDLADAQRPTGAIPPVIPAPEADMGDGGPAWADAVLICPWTIYRCYGDATLLRRHWDTFQRYAGFLQSQCLDDIRLHPDLGRWGGFGDWLALDGSGHVDGGTPKDLIATAFYAHDLHLLSEMASVLGDASAAASYAAREREVAAAFRRRFLTDDGLLAGTTQTAYVLALHFDLVSPELRPKLLAELVRDVKGRGNKLSTGFVGTPYLLHVLTRGGETDLAYRLLLQTEWPSWLYPVTQGATTIWERWDGWTREHGFEDAGMNSFNHYAYGAVGDWLYRVVAGIELDPAVPAYKHVRLQPQPGGGLTFARASHRSPYGEIVSDWHTAAGTFDWEVTVPPNTTATATFPVPADATVREGDAPLGSAEGVTHLGVENGHPVCTLTSGTYRFHATWTAR